MKAASSLVFVALVLLLCGVVASWLVLRADGDTPEFGATAAETDPTDAEIAQVFADYAPEDPLDPLLDDSSADERRMVEDSIAESIPGEHDGPVAIVLDGPGGPPVPGAEVRFIERDDARARQRDADLPGNLLDAELAERFGAVRRADAAGRVPLPVPRDRLLVVALHGDRFGFAAVTDRRASEVPVALIADEVLHLLVLDASGEPAAGVPIAVWSMAEGGEPDRIWQGESEAGGRAHVPHFQCVRPDAATRFGVGFRFPQANAAPTGFRGRPAPDEPIVLRMPACGTVTLTVVDRAGAPVHGDLRLALTSIRAADPQVWLPGWSDAISARKEAGATAVTFAPVAVGTQLRVSARLEDRSTRWTGPEFIGPTYPGEEVRVALEAPEWLALVRGRVLDVDGTPLASARPACLLRMDDRTLHGTRLTTTADGEFEFGFRIGDVQGPFTLDVRDDRREGPPAAGYGSLPSLVPGVRADIGEVRLTGLMPLATGRVVDDRGDPVADVAITIERLDATVAKERWQRDPLTRAASGADGQFTVFDAPRGGSMRLRAARRGYVETRSAAFVVATRVDDLVLVREGGLDATFALPDWLPNRALSGSLLAAGVARPIEREDIRNDRGRGLLRMRGIKPGIYDLRIDLRNHPAPLVVLSSVRIEPGDGARDPRLRDIDLTSGLHSFEVRAVGPDGQPLADVRGAVVGRVWLPGGEQRWIGLQWRDGTARFISTHTTAEIWTLGMGRRAVQTVVSPGRSDVVLAPLHPIEVVMPGLRAAVGAERRVRVSLVLAGDTGLPTSLSGVDPWTGRSYSFERSMLGKSGGAWLGDGDRVRMDLQRNGRYQVVARLYEPGVRGPSSRVLDTVEVVLDGPTMQVVTAKVNQRAIDSALAELQRRAQR